MIRPQWSWQFQGLDGEVVGSPSSPLFTNQHDAEVWIGEMWRVLASQGVGVATVLHDGAPAAPPVPLEMP